MKKEIKSYYFRSKGGSALGIFKGRNIKEAFKNLIKASDYKDHNNKKVSGYGSLENFHWEELYNEGKTGEL